MTDETDIIERVVDIQQLIVNPYTSAVLSAKEKMPKNILDGELPLFLNVLGTQSPRQRVAPDSALKQITLEMRLYVKAAGQGVEAEAQTLTEQLIEPVENAFDARPRLELNDAGLTDVQFAFITQTTQNAFLPYAGKNYIGIIFNLQVAFVRVTRQV
jgi:hypothetical protein